MFSAVMVLDYLDPLRSIIALLLEGHYRAPNKVKSRFTSTIHLFSYRVSHLHSTAKLPKDLTSIPGSAGFISPTPYSRRVVITLRRATKTKR